MHSLNVKCQGVDEGREEYMVIKGRQENDTRICAVVHCAITTQSVSLSVALAPLRPLEQSLPLRVQHLVLYVLPRSLIK